VGPGEGVGVGGMSGGISGVKLKVKGTTDRRWVQVPGRGLHSSTSQLDLSRF